MVKLTDEERIKQRAEALVTSKKIGWSKALELARKTVRPPEKSHGR